MSNIIMMCSAPDYHNLGLMLNDVNKSLTVSIIIISCNSVVVYSERFSIWAVTGISRGEPIRTNLAYTTQWLFFCFSSLDDSVLRNNETCSLQSFLNFTRMNDTQHLITVEELHTNCLMDLEIVKYDLDT